MVLELLWVLIDLLIKDYCERLTYASMGFCLDPYDRVRLFNGLSVGRIRRYPLIRIWMEGLPMCLLVEITSIT